VAGRERVAKMVREEEEEEGWDYARGKLGESGGKRESSLDIRDTAVSHFSSRSLTIARRRDNKLDIDRDIFIIINRPQVPKVPY